MYAVTHEYAIYVYRFPHDNTAVMRGRSTQPTILGHFACVLKTKARYTRMCASVTPAKPYIIPGSSEGSRDPSVASCAGVDVRRPSFHLAFCLRLHSASGFQTPPAPVEAQALTLLKQPRGPQRDPLQRPGVCRKGYSTSTFPAADPTKGGVSPGDNILSALGRHPNQSGGRISRFEAGYCASPGALPPASGERTRAQGSVGLQLGRARTRQPRPSRGAPGVAPDRCPVRPRWSVPESREGSRTTALRTHSARLGAPPGLLCACATRNLGFALGTPPHTVPTANREVQRAAG